MPRPCLFDRPLTNAEKQARVRRNRAAEQQRLLEERALLKQQLQGLQQGGKPAPHPPAPPASPAPQAATQSTITVTMLPPANARNPALEAECQRLRSFVQWIADNTSDPYLLSHAIKHGAKRVRPRYD